jgi:hypothetical protein
MSVDLSKALVAFPFTQQISSFSASARSFVDRVRHRLYNILSKCLFEPQESLQQMIRNDARVGRLKREYLQLFFPSNPAERPRVYCQPPVKSIENIVGEFFHNKNVCSVLEDLQPAIAKKEERESFSREFVQYLQKGMCYGESLVLLKLARYFPFSGPLRDNILLDKYSSIAAFLQLIGLLKSKWQAIPLIKEALAKEGYLVDRLFTKEGKLDEAELFHYLSVAFPTSTKENLRHMIQCLFAEDFQFNEKELQEKIQRLCQIEKEFMHSSRQHSNLPLIPQGVWKRRQQIVKLDNKMKNFENKAVAIAQRFFQNTSGSFILSVWSEYDAHAIFMKKEGEVLLYYDTIAKTWMIFSHASESLKPLLKSMVAIVDPKEFVEISIDTVT